MNDNEQLKFLLKTRTEFLKKEIGIISEYKNNLKGINYCSKLSGLYDETIYNIFNHFFREEQNIIALAATGGYGRNEVCLRSDVDIIFLEKERGTKKNIETRIKEVINFLWDIKFDIGYTIRNFDDCIEMFHNDQRSFSAILEIRYICGDYSVYSDFMERLRLFLTNEKDYQFLYSILEEIEKRHDKYGNSIKLLEPNIKYSAGGLRDLHSLLWIFSCLEPSFLIKNHNASDYYNFNGNKTELNAIVRLLNFLKSKNIINRISFEQTLEAYNFLLRVRNEIHYIEKIRSDHLGFRIQSRIADGLGYKQKDGVRLFMRDYYLHARKINRLNLLLSEKIFDLITAKKSRLGRKRILDNTFIINNGMLSLRSEKYHSFNSDMIKIFMAFYYKSKFRIRFDENIRNLIVNSLEKFDEKIQKNPLASEIFIKILKSGKNLAFTLESMNELGILGRYIPEFGKLIALYQYSKYHYYTADEHTLKAIRQAEELSKQDTPIGKTFRSIKNKEILYLSLLFHDLGKIFSIKEHDNIGAELSLMILERLGYAKYFKTIFFLIKNHLLMEKVAFRRNCDDLHTIFNFANEIKNITLLKYLYILTYADLSAVNPSVWTEWKNHLLWELYQKTYDVLKNKRKIDIMKEIRKENALLEKEKIRELLFPYISNDTLENYFDNLIDTGYIFAFDRKEISRHISSLSTGAKISSIFHDKENYTELTVISYNSPNLLSKICGVLTANDSTIFDAKIFTGTNNIVIDSFRVANFLTNSSITEEQKKKISEDLISIINDKLDIENLIDLQKRRWLRKIKSINYETIPIDATFEDEKNYTIVDILTPDIIGLLYEFTKMFSEMNYSINFAKASTYGDRSICSFYLIPPEKIKIGIEEKKILKNRILSIIEEAK